MSNKPHFLAMLLVCGLCSACGSTTRVIHEGTGVEPATYVPATSATSLSRSVGLLKRLAVLPPMVEVHPENSRWCMDPCDPEADRKQLSASVADYLVDWRGYEIELFDRPCEHHPQVEASDSDECILAKLLLAWTRHADGQHELPPELAARVRAAGAEIGVDGVVLLHGKFDYVQYADSLHWLATLTFSAYWNLARGHVATVRADIFSVERPGRVWQSRTTLRNFGTAPANPRLESYGESIMSPIEPALPDLFIRATK